MGIKKKKISELPLAQSLVGLFTIGVDKFNKSVKVGLEFVKTAADNATAAASSANNAASSATSAATSANNAASSANTAARGASAAKKAANTAADSANSAASSANAAATSATNAAQSANSAADRVETAITNAQNATSEANTAAGNANTKATAANTAATLANQKATLADQKATEAGNATTAATAAKDAANTAASNANAKATAANTAASNANTKAAAADTAAGAANSAASSANAKATAADAAAKNAERSADKADTSSVQALDAASDARSAAAMVQNIKSASIAVDKIKENDTTSFTESYALISMNRPKGYIYYVPAGLKLMMPLFEATYPVSQDGHVNIKSYACPAGEPYICDIVIDNHTQQITIDIQDIPIPNAYFANTVRELYLRQLYSGALLTLTQKDSSYKVIKTEQFPPKHKAEMFTLSSNTSYVSLNIDSRYISKCGHFSVYCTNTGYDLCYNIVPDDNHLRQGGEFLLCKSKTGKYDIITLRDSVRYVHEKSAFRIYDRMELNYVSERIDIRDYVDVLFHKTISDLNNPYEAINIKTTSKCGRVGIFIHKKWKQRKINKKGGYIPGGSKNYHKYSLAKAGIDKLPPAEAVFPITDTAKYGSHYFSKRTHIPGNGEPWCTRYISCYVSIYKVPNPRIEQRGGIQPKIPIGERVYFTFRNRPVKMHDGTVKRAWTVEE